MKRTIYPSIMSKKINLIRVVENYEAFSVLSYMSVVCKLEHEQNQINYAETK